jgi:hypothetical protein
MMTEEQMLQAMIKDAQQINKRYREKWGGKPDKKYTEPEPDKPDKKYTEPEATAAPTRGSGWRNDPLSQKEIDDILYFQSKGWCVTSTALFLGLNDKTVRKYRDSAS